MTSEWQAKLLRQSRAAVHDLRKQQIGEDEFNRCEAAKREATEWLWARAEPLATVAKQNGFHFFDCRVGDSSRENMAIIFRFSDGKGSHYICRLSGYKRILKKNDCQLSLADGVDIKVGIQSRVLNMPGIKSAHFIGKRVKQPISAPSPRPRGSR
jgi:ribosomal protein L17